MSKKLEMSQHEWITMTFAPDWINVYDEGDIIKVYHPSGNVFRYKIVTRKIAEPI